MLPLAADCAAATAGRTNRPQASTRPASRRTYMVLLLILDVNELRTNEATISPNLGMACLGGRGYLDPSSKSMARTNSSCHRRTRRPPRRLGSVGPARV